MGLIHLGWLSYPSASTPLPPIWIISLYPLFSLLINHSLSFLKSSPFIAFIVGFIAAPLSYLAGVKMGGALFPHPLLSTWSVIGVLWGLFLVLLTAIAKSIDKAAEAVDEAPLKLLYDGACPLCQREIAFLKKRAVKGRVIFVDISDPNFTSRENQGIDYKTAMTEMHAIDAQGNVLVGVPAFAALYARCRLPVLATLLRIPFIQAMLTPFYKHFAKNRLRITRRCPLPPKK
jgi:predicted DCC family thiol-disulfide oxidoreductase YuxK